MVQLPKYLTVKLLADDTYVVRLGQWMVGHVKKVTDKDGRNVFTFERLTEEFPPKFSAMRMKDLKEEFVRRTTPAKLDEIYERTKKAAA